MPVPVTAVPQPMGGPSPSVLPEQSLSPVTTDYTYDDANRLLTAQVQGQPAVQYSYDADGNLLSNGADTYAYDSADRLVSMSSASGTVTMAYNGLGQRLSLTAGGVTTQYVSGGDQVVEVLSGRQAAFYLYGVGVVGQQTEAWVYDLPDAPAGGCSGGGHFLGALHAVPLALNP